MRSFAILAAGALCAGFASPLGFTVDAVGDSVPGAPLYLAVHAGDLDGDGAADEAIVKLVCVDGAVKEAFLQPRDAASGMATGKRQHAPVTFVKEWGPASPKLRAASPTYDIKKVEGTGAKTMAHDDWTRVEVAGLPPLCPAAKVTKSRSNIQNN